MEATQQATNPNLDSRPFGILQACEDTRKALKASPWPIAVYAKSLAGRSFS